MTLETTSIQSRCENLWNHLNDDTKTVVPFFKYRLGRDEFSRGIHYGDFSTYLRSIGIHPQMQSVFWDSVGRSELGMINLLKEDCNINKHTKVLIFDTVGANKDSGGGTVTYFAVLTKHLQPDD